MPLEASYQCNKEHIPQISVGEDCARGCEYYIVRELFLASGPAPAAAGLAFRYRKLKSSCAIAPMTPTNVVTPAIFLPSFAYLNVIKVPEGVPPLGLDLRKLRF